MSLSDQRRHGGCVPIEKKPNENAARRRPSASQGERPWGSHPARTLILDVQPPAQGETLLLFQPLGLWYLLWWSGRLMWCPHSLGPALDGQDRAGGQASSVYRAQPHLPSSMPLQPHRAGWGPSSTASPKSCPSPHPPPFTAPAHLLSLRV